MKKAMIILCCAFVACTNNRDFNDLTMNVDRQGDVEVKVGRPDSISTYNGDNNYEAWYYKKDDIRLLFKNDILVERGSEQEYRKDVQIMEERAKFLQDSFSRAIEESMREAAN